jgi:hypothetical protein
MDGLDLLLSFPLLIPLGILPVAVWAIERYAHRAGKNWVGTFGVPLGGRTCVVTGSEHARQSAAGTARLLGQGAQLLDERSAVLRAPETEDRRAISYAIVRVEPVPGAVQVSFSHRAKLAPPVGIMSIAAGMVVMSGASGKALIGAGIGAGVVLLGLGLIALKLREERQQLEASLSRLIASISAP